MTNSGEKEELLPEPEHPFDVYERKLRTKEEEIEKLKEQVEHSSGIAADLAYDVVDVREENKRLREAAEHFVWKVETGRAHSKESYRQFKEALEGGREG